MSDQEYIRPIEGMLVRPIHVENSWRTIVRAEWQVRNSVMTGAPETHVRCDFLLIGKQEIMKTPWYPISKFWTYYTVCDEESK